MKPTHTAPQRPGRSCVVGTAGHIDHGKTALVFALTGTDTDRLLEEKSRGITIDLGFAALRVQDEDGHAFTISLIDVPGHHAFIRNMLAGTGGIDLVMLVIAADEGVKPQTVEHLSICTLLGIRQGVVVLTKRDAVSVERLTLVREQVVEFLRHTFLAGAPLLIVSSRSGEGIAALKAALTCLAAEIPERSSADLLPRLPLDRAFTIRGFGTVVTGTLLSGVIRAGDTMQLQPGGRLVRVRGIEVHGEPQKTATSPSRVALNLSGAEVGEVKRGYTLVRPETLNPTSALDVEITMLAGLPLLKHRSQVSFHAFTSDAFATVLLYPSPAQTPVAPPGNSILARLKLAQPLLVAPGDRFVLRQCSPAMTIGGGRVLDAHPLGRLKKSVTRNWLEQMRNPSSAQQALLRVRRRGMAGLSVQALAAEMALEPASVRKMADSLICSTHLASAGDNLLACEFLQQAAALLLRNLSDAKDAATTRAALASKLGLPHWLVEMALAKALENKSVEAEGERLWLACSGPRLPTEQAERLMAVEQLYYAAGLSSPTVSEVAARFSWTQSEVHLLVSTLLRAKKLLRLGADNLLMHMQAFETLTEALEKHRGEQMDIARFKTLTGLTRRHAIPLLECLDRARVTRNSNGVRVVL